MSISVVVLTFNEEVNLPRCLKSIEWSDDIVVIDSGSTDNTVAIAESAGARVVHHPFENFASQRNFGIDSGELKHRWVLHLDADECVSTALKAELLAIAEKNPKLVYRVGSKIYYRDSWIRRSSMYPCYQVRFGRADHLRFQIVGHGQRETAPLEEIATLENDLDHFSFSKGLVDWIEKHNRYSTDEVRQILLDNNRKLDWKNVFSRDRTARRRELKRLASRLPCKPILRFIYVYFLRMGFLDGRAGLEYAQMMAMYERMISLKLSEARAGKKLPVSRKTSP